ncbi:MAG TPA: IS256 family transposase [Niastella sp.]
MENKEQSTDFNFKQFEQQAIEQLKSGMALEGKDGVLAPLIKRLVEASLEGELDAHLSDKDSINRRNGKSSKQVKTSFGSIPITTPRDRNSTFEPEILAKRQTTLGEALDNKVISMYSKGMSYNDICHHLEDLYGLLVSPATLSSITNRVLEDVKSWQGRALESVYPLVWLDAIHYKVKEDGSIKTKAVYCVIGLNREGIKDLLGLYIAENEGARFWLQVLTDIQNRGVKDVFIACIDNLKGFADAIESVYPQAEVQLCVIHQIRNSTKYVPYKERKAVMADLKEVYQAATQQQAEKALYILEANWIKRYPLMVKSWLNNWDRLANYFKYPKEIRTIMYTTNIIESFHSQLRKITKSKRVFHGDQSLLKLLYLAFKDQSKGWTGPILGWKKLYAQLAIIFEERISQP